MQNPTTNFCKIFGVAFVIIYFTTTVFAQKAYLKSGNYEVYLGDNLELNLKIENIVTVPRIEFPNIKNLKFSASDRARSFNYTSIINGKITKSQGIEITIIIKAEALGIYHIPGIIFYNKQNQKEQTSGFSVKVLEANLSNSMFTEIIVDKKKYYQNEKINLNLQWYLANQVKNFELTFPILKKKDFYHLKNIPIPQNNKKKYFRFSPLDNIPFQASKVQKNGQDYTLYSSKFSLFVAETGIWSEATFSAKGDVRTQISNRTDFFGRKLWRYEKIFANSPLLELEIIPLPPSPKNFSKGVGNFQIKKTIDTQRLQVGEPINLALQINGEGNFQAIQPPKTTTWEKNFEVYYREEQTKIRENSIEFFYILRPKNEQIKKIDTINFIYFDLIKEKYTTHYIKETTLQVTPAKILSADDVLSFASLKKKEKPQKTITTLVPQLSSIKKTSEIKFLALIFLFFPPVSFLTIINWHKKRKKKNLMLKKQNILAKYKLTNNINFSKEILTWMYRFLLQKGVPEIKIQTILFHKTNLPKLQHCSQKEIFFLQRLRNIYNEIVFCGKKISIKEQKYMRLKMDVIDNV